MAEYAEVLLENKIGINKVIMFVKVKRLVKMIGLKLVNSKIAISKVSDKANGNKVIDIKAIDNKAIDNKGFALLKCCCC